MECFTKFERDVCIITIYICTSQCGENLSFKKRIKIWIKKNISIHGDIYVLRNAEKISVFKKRIKIWIKKNISIHGDINPD